MQVIHHGGKQTVTGSCHELRLGKSGVLIDCGQFQGQERAATGRYSQKVDFPVAHIEALLVTHAHIDHIGRIPWLLAAGFKGPIYCSEATAELIPLMLEDGLKIQGFSYGQCQQILQVIRKRIRPVSYRRWLRISLTDAFVYIRFQPAGHILGSVYIEIKLPDGQVVVFSGDLGACHTPLLPDPASPARADYLYLESTYGDRQHEGVAERGERLKRIIQRSLRDGGTIIIPAFSVGRTQELLFDIEQLMHTEQLDGELPIIIDSPLAHKVTKLYRRYRKLWAKEAKLRVGSLRRPLAFEQCIRIDDYRQHKALVNRLASTGEPAIVIAASGMCNGGRVVDYLKALLPDKRTDVIFAGYQAYGTLGRKIQEQPFSVDIDGNRIEVNAHIHTMSGYSAHADQDDLLRFVRGIPEAPKQIHLVHGEPKAQRALLKRIECLNGSIT
ncbi:MBL fold hydrolase [Vibrio albus]|uniref:MBL fold hydrolase n=1 Tax=Vibrio albus TaxID=2200953 RepID=A0A2U3BCN8_9VIBR|nr:MBL fold metallo-hydrolase [Vibrio albus]PWI34540.1 MBL fold hydrolase [Vibrio albus]